MHTLYLFRLNHCVRNFLSRRRIIRRIGEELLTLLRFGLVGLIATLVHLLVVWLLLSQPLLARSSNLPILANTVAYFSAFGFSFWGHYAWTFRCSKNPRTAICRFMAISVLAFISNSAILIILVNSKLFSLPVAATLSTLSVPIFSYCANRLWAFSNSMGS